MNKSDREERLNKLETVELEQDKDLKTLAGIFDDSSEIKTEHKPETEQALEFLTGGERYTQD